MTLKSNPVLVSTDIGSDPDDAISLLVMLNSGVNVKAVYTVNGDLQSRSFIAKQLLNLLGRKIPVIVGDSKSLEDRIKPYSHFEYMYVDDRFIDEKKSDIDCEICYKSLRNAGIRENAVEDMAKRLSSGEHIVFSLAPMTSIAKLIRDFPDAARNISQLYVMGFSLDPDRLEHNVRFDTDAAEIVLKSDVPVTIIPSNVCSKYRMPMTVLDLISTPAACYVKSMALSYVLINTVTNILSHIPEISTSLYNFIEWQLKKSPIDKRFKDKGRVEQVIFREGLLVNLDDNYYAAAQPFDYLNQFNALVSFLRDTKQGIRSGKVIADHLESLMPKDISVADVYIPYCFSHPDRIKLDSFTLSNDELGYTHIECGEKHNAKHNTRHNAKHNAKHKVVVGLDYTNFAEYLLTNLK